MLRSLVGSEMCIRDRYSGCGDGVIGITYAGTDECGNAISAACTVNVTGAGAASIACPVLTITCDQAPTFVPAAATFTGLCGNNGTVAGTISAAYSGCGDGVIGVAYAGTDECGNAISAACTVNVTGAGAASIACPVLTITCDQAPTFVPAAATFTGLCGNNGTVTGTCLLYTSPSPRDS